MLCLLVKEFIYVWQSARMEPAAKKSKHQCGKCQQIFNRGERLENHRKHCAVCEETFFGVKNYNHHQRTHHLAGINKCMRCQRTFLSRKVLSLHQQNSGNKECTECEKKFCTVKDYNQHQLSDHDIDVKKCAI